MSAEIIQLFDGPGFFENSKNVVVGDEEAPAYIIEAHQPYYKYYAVLKKVSGSVEARDFLKYGRRLATFSYQVYRRAMWELRADAEASLGFYISSTGERAGAAGIAKQLDVSKMNEMLLRLLFDWSCRVELRINQVSLYGSDLDSFTSIDWWRCKPDTLFICADRDGEYDHRARQLEELLLRKMFYVPGVAPDSDFSVELGFPSYDDETMGLSWSESARS